MSVRHVDDLDAKDIAVGQVWRRMVAQINDRMDWTVSRLNGDGTINVARGGVQDVVSVGTLPADWVLIAEAP